MSKALTFLTLAVGGWVGLRAIAFGVAGFPRLMAQMSGRPDLIERFHAEDCIGCWAGTEASGSACGRSGSGLRWRSSPCPRSRSSRPPSPSAGRRC